MKLVSKLLALISFFTSIPVPKRYELRDVAGGMPFLPLIGVLIGWVAGVLAYFFKLLFPEILAGVLSYSTLLLLTGINHVDGLFDFGDGIVKHGGSEERLKAMRDPSIGTGGIMVGGLITLMTILSISYIDSRTIIPAMIAAELSAKSSMLTLAFFGEPVNTRTSYAFIESMHGKNSVLKLLAPLVASLILCFTLLGVNGVVIILIGIFLSLLILTLSNKLLGCVTGDVFGALNEVSRATSLLYIIALNVRT